MIGVPQSINFPRNMSLGEMVSHVLNFVQMPNDNAARDQARSAINLGIDMLNGYTWNSQRRWFDIFLIADESEFKIASDYRATYTIQSIGSNGWARNRICYLDPDEFARITVGLNQGVARAPKFCTVINQYNWPYLTFDVPISQGYVDDNPKVRVWYLGRFSHLFKDTDAFVGPPEIVPIIIDFAREQLAQKFSTRRTQLARQNWTMALRRARVEDNELHHYAILEG